MATAKKTPATKTAATPAKKTAAAAKPEVAAKKPGTAIVAWEAEMLARAKKTAVAEAVQSGVKKIGTRGGILTIDDEPIEGNELRCIVIAHIHENQMYEDDYDSSKPAVPMCYAFSEPDSEDPESTMVAHEKAENPQGQADPDEPGANGNPCDGCWANKMGSAEKGRGKACKNIRRLAIITEDALASSEELAAAEHRVINVPVMSVKNWAKFANHINDEMGRPPEAVVCTIGIQPDPKSQFVITFKFEELINFDQDLWDAMNKKRDSVMRELVLPYPSMADMAAAAKPVQVRGRMAQSMAKGKPAGKGAAPAKRGKF